MKPRSIALLLSPLGLLLLSATRLLIVSDYNATTATTIAASGGYINTLLGSIIPLIPIYIPFVALLLLLFRQFFLSIVAFVFTAFIAPTPLSLPVTRHLASIDESRVSADIAQHPEITIVIVLLVALAVWSYHRSLTDALSTVVAVFVVIGLLFASSRTAPTLPAALHLAGAEEGRVHSWVVGDAPRAILISAFAVTGLWIYHGHPGGAVTTIVAFLATIVLFPYVYNIYPIPRQGSYYFAILKEPWLNAEEFRLQSGRTIYGYAISTQGNWFTVLLENSRKIVYVPAVHVIGQKVCRTDIQGQPKQYPPLIDALYSRPAQLPQCPSYDSTVRESVLSHGQSLHAISVKVGVPPGRIIAITGSYQNQRLSAALRDYESRHDWRAATPVGQRFWYFAPYVKEPPTASLGPAKATGK